MEHPQKPSANPSPANIPANRKSSYSETSKDSSLFSHTQEMGSRREADGATTARYATDGNINVVESLADIPPTEEEIIFSELSSRNRFQIHDVDEETLPPNEEELSYFNMSIVGSLEDSILNDERTQAHNDITLEWLKENHPELIDEFEDLAIA